MPAASAPETVLPLLPMLLLTLCAPASPAAPGGTIPRPSTPAAAKPSAPGDAGWLGTCAPEASASGFSAARTTSGVNGGCRKRTPVASKIALAIAAVPGTDEDSPAPKTGSPGRGGTTTSITGTCRKLRMG
jgi:hypothetical protein